MGWQIGDAEWLRDRALIGDLINRYAQAADAGDFERLLTCFADDARMESAQGVRQGIEEIRASMSPEGLRQSRAAASGLQFDRSTHLMGAPVISIDGDRAHAESPCVAYLVGPLEGREVLVVRGLTYSDDFVRHAREWRISRRIHRAVWQSAAAPL